MTESVKQNRRQEEACGKERGKPEPLRLSKRLQLVASFVQEGSRIADIGTDHGYVPIYLARTGRIRSAIAMDVGKEPLARAKEHIEAYWGTGKAAGPAATVTAACPITTRLSDGLKELRAGEADTVIMAGMGGELETHIMEEGRRLWDSIDRWILSPQSDLDKVRRFLAENGFSIGREAMVKDSGKFYTVMLATRGRMEYENQAQYLYGKLLIEQRDEVLKEYLRREQNRVEKILAELTEGNADGNFARRAGKADGAVAYEADGIVRTPAQREAIARLREELFWIKEARDEMQ